MRPTSSVVLTGEGLLMSSDCAPTFGEFENSRRTRILIDQIAGLVTLIKNLRGKRSRGNER
jgi:hypothetical protein